MVSSKPIHPYASEFRFDPLHAHTYPSRKVSSTKRLKIISGSCGCALAGSPPSSRGRLRPPCRRHRWAWAFYFVQQLSKLEKTYERFPMISYVMSSLYFETAWFLTFVKKLSIVWLRIFDTATFTISTKPLTYMQKMGSSLLWMKHDVHHDMCLVRERERMIWKDMIITICMMKLMRMTRATM